MEVKKNPKLDLERYDLFFFLVGIIVALGIVIFLINIRFYDKAQPSTVTPKTYKEDNAIPVTIQQLPLPPASAPSPAPSPEQFQVVDDNVKLNDELNIGVTETDENEMLYSSTPGEAPSQGNVVAIAEEPEESNEVFSFEVVETVPVFPGCENAINNEERKICFQQKMLEFVAADFKYPKEAAALHLQGKIFIQFVVERDGSVSNIKVVRGVGASLDSEAVRVIGDLPKIEPARQRGKPVRMSFVMPITAILRN